MSEREPPVPENRTDGDNPVVVWTFIEPTRCELKGLKDGPPRWAEALLEH